MKLFYEDGHLTEEGLQAIVTGELDEMQSLEAAEHLSYCDACLECYTKLLTEETSMEPETPIKQPVMQNVRKRALRVVGSRYATVAAAACLAVGLWITGSFAVAALPSAEQAQPQTAQQPPSIGVRLNTAVETVGATLDDFFSSLLRGAPGEGDEADAASEPNEPDDANSA